MEVLVALVVISVGLLGLIQAAQLGERTTTELRQKTAAYHVADQVMMLLYQNTGLQLGLHQGQELYAGQDYYWQAELLTTDNPAINRINLQVSLDRQFNYAVAQLSGFKKQ